MILTSIWERYFLRQTAKIFALFLLGFYGLYVLIDYSNHASSFKHYHFTLVDIIKFYGYEFVARVDVLVPFAILIACVKTLCSLNANNELIALMASGIRMKRLLFPFIAFGLFFTFLIYFNTEVLQPLAAQYNTQLDKSRAKAKQKKYLPVQQLTLEDGSSLIFQYYDEAQRAFSDTYWVRSSDDIYRINQLFPYADVPHGKTVEHLQRNQEGFIVTTEKFPEMSFNEMLFNQKKLTDSLASPDSQSLSALYHKLPVHEHELNEKEARLLTTFYYKLAMPWLCLIAVLAPAPFCLHFSRSRPLFFIYALSIFGLVAFYLVMDAASVLGERQAISPALAIWTPFTCFLALFSYRFLKI
ncbi:MAG: LptF/LptG family permease [Parachlamydiaceae bacterium]